jgi:NAD(P)H-hydrate epimerase
MAAVDAAAIDAGLPGVALMETAGRAVTAAIIGRWGETGRARILVGKGNNGGDGLVVARTLVAGGWGADRERVASCRFGPATRVYVWG